MTVASRHDFIELGLELLLLRRLHLDTLQEHDFERLKLLHLFKVDICFFFLLLHPLLVQLLILLDLGLPQIFVALGLLRNGTSELRHVSLIPSNEPRSLAVPLAFIEHPPIFLRSYSFLL